MGKIILDVLALVAICNVMWLIFCVARLSYNMNRLDTLRTKKIEVDAALVSAELAIDEVFDSYKLAGHKLAKMNPDLIESHVAGYGLMIDELNQTRRDTYESTGWADSLYDARRCMQLYRDVLNKEKEGEGEWETQSLT